MATNFPSADKTLSFSQRVELAVKERENIQTDYESNKRKEANDIMDTVEAFVKKLTDGGQLIDQIIRSIHHSRSDSRRKVVEVFTFNAWAEFGRIYNQGIPSVGFEGKNYSTKYIISGGYRKLTDKYIPERSRIVKELLQEIINTEKYYTGKDPETGHPLHVCVFWKKGARSSFKNGIYISRDGVEYS